MTFEERVRRITSAAAELADALVDLGSAAERAAAAQAKFTEAWKTMQPERTS